MELVEVHTCSGVIKQPVSRLRLTLEAMAFERLDDRLDHCTDSDESLLLRKRLQMSSWKYSSKERCSRKALTEVSKIKYYK